MPVGNILNVTKKKPKDMKGKTFIWKKNPKNGTWVKFRRLAYRK